jgi:hypothetical protein
VNAIILLLDINCGRGIQVVGHLVLVAVDGGYRFLFAGLRYWSVSHCSVIKDHIVQLAVFVLTV